MTDYPVSYPAGIITASTKEVKSIDTNTHRTANAKTADLKRMLERVHPDYPYLCEYWRMAGDFAFNRIKNDADKSKYLPQFTNEGPQSYAMRLKLTPVAPETPQLLDDFISLLFSQPATREVREDIGSSELRDRIEAFVDRAGIDGESMDEISRKAQKMAAVYNRVDAILDHPADYETEVPYVYLLTPDKRIDWEEDEHGKLIWVKYHKRYLERPDWDGDIFTVDEYTIIDDEKYCNYFIVRSSNTGEEAIRGPVEVPHVFHDIPVVVLQWDKDGEAWGKPLVDLDKRILQVESDHAYDLGESGHPPILAWLHPDPETGETQNAVNRIKQGIEKLIHLNPGDTDKQPENVERLALDIGPLEHQISHAHELRQRVRLLAGSGSDGISESGEMASPESGIALNIKRELRERREKIASRNLEEWEIKLLEYVIREGMKDGEEWDDEEGMEKYVNLQYPNEFDQRDAAEIAQLIPVADQMGSKKLSAAIRKAEARKLMGSGVTHEVMAEIDEEIENAVDSGMVALTEAEQAEMDREHETEQADKDRAAKTKEKGNGGRQKEA